MKHYKFYAFILLSFGAASIFAEPQNYAVVSTPPGSGYLWCDVSSPPETADSKFPMTEKKLKTVSAFITTYCVNVSGMNCDVKSVKSGTLQTNLNWLKNHALKYDKSGKINGDPPNCKDPGIVQLITFYTYNLNCHVGVAPPKKLQVATEPIC